jgi:hypothetical protein
LFDSYFDWLFSIYDYLLDISLFFGLSTAIEFFTDFSVNYFIFDINPEIGFSKGSYSSKSNFCNKSILIRKGSTLSSSFEFSLASGSSSFFLFFGDDKRGFLSFALTKEGTYSDKKFYYLKLLSTYFMYFSVFSSKILLIMS